MEFSIFGNNKQIVIQSYQLQILLLKLILKRKRKQLTMTICLPGVIALFCRQYDIIKDNEPNNNKDKAKNSSECSTPEHPQGGLLRSNV